MREAAISLLLAISSGFLLYEFPTAMASYRFVHSGMELNFSTFAGSIDYYIMNLL